MQQVSGRLMADAHHFADFLRAEIVEIAQLDGFLLSFGQAFHGTAKFGGLLATHFSFDPFGLNGHFGRQPMGQKGFLLARNRVLEYFQKPVSQRPKKIKTHRTGLAEIFPVLPQMQKKVLDLVAHRPPVMANAITIAEQIGNILCVQLGKSVVVAIQKSCPERRILLVNVFQTSGLLEGKDDKPCCYWAENVSPKYFFPCKYSSQGSKSELFGITAHPTKGFSLKMWPPGLALILAAICRPILGAVRAHQTRLPHRPSSPSPHPGNNASRPASAKTQRLPDRWPLLSKPTGQHSNRDVEPTRFLPQKRTSPPPSLHGPKKRTAGHPAGAFAKWAQRRYIYMAAVFWPWTS